MAIQAECPRCLHRQSLRNKKCKCGHNLVDAKRRGVRYWLHYRLPSGQRIREFAGNNLQEAKAAEGKRLSQKAEGTILNAVNGKSLTCADISEWYLSLEKTKALSYFDSLIYNLASINKSVGFLRVLDLRQVDLENHQIRRQAQGMSASYIDKEVGALRRAIKKAADNDKISYDALRPFRQLSDMLPKKNSNARDRIITPEEFQKIYGALPPHAAGIWACGYYTGMRPGEPVQLRWDQVNLKTREITMDAAQTKDSESRKIPIPEPLFQIFLNTTRALHCDYVFPFKGHPVKSIRAAVKSACTKLGIPYGRNTKGGLTPHDLRHTFVTTMRRAGVDEQVIMKITGHSTREMFDRYDHVSHEEAVKAMALYEKKLGDQFGSGNHFGMETG